MYIYMYVYIAWGLNCVKYSNQKIRVFQVQSETMDEIFFVIVHFFKSFFFFFKYKKNFISILK